MMTALRRDNSGIFARLRAPNRTRLRPSSGPRVDLSSVVADCCVGCGKDNTNLRCSGHLISAKIRTLCCSRYCNSTCQTESCRTHNVACKQVRQLSRVVSMFADIFNYVLCMAYQNQYMIQSITGDQSMVIARTQSNGAVSLDSFGAATWRDFPFQLTAPEMATAVLMHTQCSSPLGDPRSLFEMLIRRKPPCATLLAVNERHSCLSIRPQGSVRAQERDQTGPHHPLQLQ